MCQNEARAEEMPVPEVYEGDAIKSIRFFGNKKHPDSVGIRLKNGKYIEVVSGLRLFPERLESQLELKRGGWIGKA
jgi:hypothetical protein